MLHSLSSNLRKLLRNTIGFSESPNTWSFIYSDVQLSLMIFCRPWSRIPLSTTLLAAVDLCGCVPWLHLFRAFEMSMRVQYARYVREIPVSSSCHRVGSRFIHSVCYRSIQWLRQSWSSNWCNAYPAPSSSLWPSFTSSRPGNVVSCTKSGNSTSDRPLLLSF